MVSTAPVSLSLNKRSEGLFTRLLFTERRTFAHVHAKGAQFVDIVNYTAEVKFLAGEELLHQRIRLLSDCEESGRGAATGEVME